MMRPNENALTPASLATDGEQGGDARADGHCGAQHSRQEAGALFLARVALDAALAQLDAYALLTDAPRAGTIEAADLLEAARAALAGAP